mgnify:CR=1 FL=1
MKRVLQILIGYLLFAFCACMAFALFAGTLPPLIAKTETLYRLYAGLALFCRILPALSVTGFVIGCAVSFGRNPDGSARRFSQAMFRRYRNVVVTSLALSLVLTAASEIGTPILSAKQRQLERMPLLVQEYVRVGRQVEGAGRGALSNRYAELALKIDPSSPDALALFRDTEIASREAHNTPRTSARQTADVPVSEEGYTVHELRALAEKAYAEKKYFDAHYWAQSAVSITTPRDTNYAELQRIAADAWNALFSADLPATTDAQKIYAQKLSGYAALAEGDNLKAYYIFRTLSLASRENANDPDIVRYLAIAHARLDAEYFFIDEIIDAKEFETAGEVYFSLKKDDGTTSIVYIKGITPVKGSGGVVQYLRSLSIFSIDANGAYTDSVYVPYAKMRQVSAADFDADTKRSLGVPDGAHFVPYVLLRSIDRDTEGVTEGPLYRSASSDKKDGRDQIALPLSYEDFLLLTEVSRGAEYMNMISLLRFAGNAERFGYSDEVFAQVLLNRILYPLFMLIVFIWFASFAWNYRVGETVLFKMSWIFAFPFFSVLAHILYRALMWLFKIINYVFIGIAGTYCLPLGALVYAVILLIVSLVFLARSEG